MMIPINDRFLFACFRKKYEATVINPIALTLIIIAPNHVHETVINQKKGLGKGGKSTSSMVKRVCKQTILGRRTHSIIVSETWD